MLPSNVRKPGPKVNVVLAKEKVFAYARSSVSLRLRSLTPSPPKQPPLYSDQIRFVRCGLCPDWKSVRAVMLPSGVLEVRPEADSDTKSKRVVGL